MKSKKEIYRFLTVEVGAYCAGPDVESTYTLKDKVFSKIKIVKSVDIKHINIPQFDRRTVETMIDYAESYPEVMEKFPIKRELEKYPRQYIANVVSRH